MQVPATELPAEISKAVAMGDLYGKRQGRTTWPGSGRSSSNALTTPAEEAHAELSLMAPTRRTRAIRDKAGFGSERWWSSTRARTGCPFDLTSSRRARNPTWRRADLDDLADRTRVLRISKGGGRYGGRW